MTDLDLADDSVAGLVAWYSLIHIPDDQIGVVFAHFRRVVRPGGPLLLGFHVGDETTLKTEGYGGHPMNVHVHRRQPAAGGGLAARAAASRSTRRPLSPRRRAGSAASSSDDESPDRPLSSLPPLLASTANAFAVFDVEWGD